MRIMKLYTSFTYKEDERFDVPSISNEETESLIERVKMSVM